MTHTLTAILKRVGEDRNGVAAKVQWSEFISANGVTCTLYTIQQAISIALDCYLPDNQARKRAGQYFEDLFSSLLRLMRIEWRRVNFRLPIQGIGGPTFNIEVDRVLNTHGPVLSAQGQIDPSDLLVSLKTSSKDRFSKLLADNFIAGKIGGRLPKLAAVFHNDVQRTRTDGVSVTFLAQQYLIYTTYLSKPSGVYYVDPPAHATKSPWSATIKPIENLLLDDLWTL
jgi:hypothetical protein